MKQTGNIFISSSVINAENRKRNIQIKNIKPANPLYLSFENIKNKKIVVYVSFYF